HVAVERVVERGVDGRAPHAIDLHADRGRRRVAGGGAGGAGAVARAAGGAGARAAVARAGGGGGGGGAGAAAAAGAAGAAAAAGRRERRQEPDRDRREDAEVFHGAHIPLLVLAQAATRAPPAVTRDLSTETTIDSTFLPAKKSFVGMVPMLVWLSMPAM